jgi:hypothetical protein
MDPARSPLSAKRAQELVQLILNCCDNKEKASEYLLELLRGLTDPKGDSLKYAVAEEAARIAYTYTEAFDKAFREFADGTSRPDVHIEKDTDNDLAS